MIKRLYFGQYGHKDSIVHKIDPRLKLVFIFIFSIMAFTIDKPFERLVFTMFILFIILISKIEAKMLFRNLRPFYFMFAFILTMYLIFSREQLKQGLIVIWRFFMLITMSFVLTYTTTISNLVAAIEKLIKPLGVFKIKPRNVAVMISITVRFIPVMFVNLEKLREAMASRLADFRKFRHIKLLMISLLERMFKSASNLSDAMRSRLYNENAGSSKTMKFGTCDYVSAILIAMLIAFIY